MDAYHDLAPVIEGLARAKPASVELHLVGDGGSAALPGPRRHGGRWRCASTARSAHRRVPEFIASADACLAPYPVSVFPGGLIAGLHAQDPRIHGLCAPRDQCAERPHPPLGRGPSDRVPVRQRGLGLGRVPGRRCRRASGSRRWGGLRRRWSRRSAGSARRPAISSVARAVLGMAAYTAGRQGPISASRFRPCRTAHVVHHPRPGQVDIRSTILTPTGN